MSLHRRPASRTRCPSTGCASREAVRTGHELLADLEGSRDLHNLAFVRVNLAAAHLALDETAAARGLLSAGWSQIAVFDFMTPYLADYMALLAAVARSWQLAQAAPDDPQTRRLMQLGAKMNDDDAGAWAFSLVAPIRSDVATPSAELLGTRAARARASD